MNILLVGECGTGKTWVMKELLRSRDNWQAELAFGMVKGVMAGDIFVAGVYDGSTFEGSDRLSMAVARDFGELKRATEELELHVIAEGDRFMNQKYIETMQPYIIKIAGNGAEGRAKRGSEQSERQLKTIATRVRNIQADAEAPDSKEALALIQRFIGRE